MLKDGSRSLKALPELEFLALFAIELGQVHQCLPDLVLVVKGLKRRLANLQLAFGVLVLALMQVDPA